MKNHKSKYSLAVGKYKSLLYRAWTTKDRREEFDALQEKYCAGSRAAEDRIAAFWKAYSEMAKEHGAIEGIEVPEGYTAEEPPADESLETLQKKANSTNILEDFDWAYQAPKTAVIEEAPSAGAWFFYDMRKNNKNKFADLTLRVLDRLAAQQDEQKSRKADYAEAVGLLEGAAEKHFEPKDFRKLRGAVRRGAQRVEGQSAVPSEGT
jgi:hypothetical protein